MLDGGDRPSWLVEDSAWLPSDDAFARYDANADLGLLYTDGEYDVLAFEDIGVPAVDAFDALRLGLDAPGIPRTREMASSELLTHGATVSERLDVGFPLLILARREDGVPFAAVQRWPAIEQLIEQDRPRRARGESPAPALGGQPDSVQRRRRLGWVLRSVLVVAAIVVGGLLGLLVVDSDGPVGFFTRDLTTAANAFPSDARLTVTSGEQQQSLKLLRRTSENITTFRQVRWTLNEPLTIAYWPGNAEDESHSVTIDLRDNGATALNQGSYVEIDLDISDDAAVLTIVQPTQQFFRLERTSVYQVILDRRTRTSSPALPPAPSAPSPPRQDVTFEQCVRSEVDRFSDLREELDLYAMYSSVESELLADDNAISMNEGEVLVARMRQHARDVEARLESSELLSSRPPESPLPALFDEMFALQAEMTAAWETPGVDAINAIYAEFMNSSDFLIFFGSYLEGDAIALCS